MKNNCEFLVINRFKSKSQEEFSEKINLALRVLYQRKLKNNSICNIVSETKNEEHS